MLFGRVIGNAVSTRKAGRLEGRPFLVVRYLDSDLQPTPMTSVAVDTVSARPGDTVLLCSSSSARMTAKTRDACVDLIVVGIVDAVSAGKRDVYSRQL